MSIPNMFEPVENDASILHLTFPAIGLHHEFLAIVRWTELDFTTAVRTDRNKVISKFYFFHRILNFLL
jgi:hypothetical protein